MKSTNKLILATSAILIYFNSESKKNKQRNESEKDEEEVLNFARKKMLEYKEFDNVKKHLLVISDMSHKYEASKVKKIIERLDQEKIKRTFFPI